MTVPSGMFAPGGRTGIAKEKVTGVIPIQWLEAHPATRRWMGRAERVQVPAAEVQDPAVLLKDGFEGIIRYLAITGKQTFKDQTKASLGASSSTRCQWSRPSGMLVSV